MKPNQEIASKIITYIEQHLQESLTLEDFARITGYSKSHLNRMFCKTTGQTIHQYMQQQRLYWAAQELQETERPITEIALESGYASQQAFSFAFKQVFQLSPLRYRQQQNMQIQQRMLLSIVDGLKRSTDMSCCDRGGMAA